MLNSSIVKGGSSNDINNMNNSTGVSSRTASFDSADETNTSNYRKHCQSVGSNYSSDSPEEKGEKGPHKINKKKSLNSNSKPFEYQINREMEINIITQEIESGQYTHPKSRTTMNTPENKRPFAENPFIYPNECIFSVHNPQQGDLRRGMRPQIHGHNSLIKIGRNLPGMTQIGHLMANNFQKNEERIKLENIVKKLKSRGINISNLDILRGDSAIKLQEILTKEEYNLLLITKEEKDEDHLLEETMKINAGLV